MDEKAYSKLGTGKPAAIEVIIFGSGACAQKIAANLADHAIQVSLVTSRKKLPASQGNPETHWITNSKPVDCRGFAKDFEVVLKKNGSFLRQKAHAVIVAEDHEPFPNFSSYGINPDSQVIDISGLEEKLKEETPETLFKDKANIAFLCGWYKDSHPAVSKRMLNCCLQLQTLSRINTFFFTGNLKVAADGAEAVCQQAKKSGTVFLKFTRTYPSVQKLADGRFEITYPDELTRSSFQLNADWIVVDESVGPSQALDALAPALRIQTDDLGFAQGDNVHRLSNATNRRGVFVAGGSRAILSMDEQLADADQVTLKLLEYLDDRDIDPLPKVEISRGRCARCLTCYRLCPHQAIDIGDCISVVSQACQSCGICLAGCPARAIDMQGVQIRQQIKTAIQKPIGGIHRQTQAAKVIVLGCGRSAGQAYQLARLAGRVLPKGVRFVEVPCGGTISDRHLLAAFEAGADGVVVCTCHTDNCKSTRGNILAGKRADSALHVLELSGMEKERLKVTSVAANMGNEFYFMVADFVDRIETLMDLSSR
ncbi:MAG: hydrogenase iron-sulfur subunit [Desulfobacteraceae bacterium]|jgi:heterodisulfide reductase subunit A-like polyferredoxin/coenzyme F420-reducing hydrogenase delta subunit